jgi:aryl-alcohol dehydrogenase-like predicted oxidoreductase
VALAWLVRQPGVTAPIVGTSRPEQLDQLVGALDITLDEDECGFLEKRYTPHAVLGHS